MQSSPKTTDDLVPLSFGENNTADDVLRDFPDWWGAAPDSPHKSHGYSRNNDPPLESSSSPQRAPNRQSFHSTSVSLTNHSSSRATDDLHTAVSDETDNASRSSVKRRRTGTALGFQPLAQVREGGGVDSKEDDSVRPWMVEVRDHDVVLGDTHEPTWGTKVYREIRKPYAKKTLDNEQLKLVKMEFQRRLEKDLGHKLKILPTFWVNKDYTAKIKQSQVAGCLKNRPGITYAYAKDQAIKDDIKNASARSRTRNNKIFACKGTLAEAIDMALETVKEWVGEDVDKELYARNFREDLKRLVPWHDGYVGKKNDSVQRAFVEPEMKATHMREARIHEAHASHLEIALVEMINRMGNLMVEGHRNARKSTNSAAKSSVSVDGSASCTSSKAKPPLGARANYGVAKRGALGARPRVVRRLRDSDEHGNVTISSSTWSGIDSQATTEDGRATMEDDEGHESVEMDMSPISVRKAMLAENLGQTFVMPSSASARDNRKKDLEVMFNTLRMGTGDDVPREVDQEAPDELSVLSMPDDVSVLLEARELAIRRGIDQPAALPRAGHVADRTKALLQQMGSKGQKKEG